MLIKFIYITGVLLGLGLAYLGRGIHDPRWRQFARKRDMTLAGTFFGLGGLMAGAGTGAVFGLI
jgi:hypothetical protein